jgi:hypothetical protein
MGERGTQLHEKADGQISELIGLVSGNSEGSLKLPCRGREKLGDGTVAALALHTADNYLRIAGFLRAAGQLPGAPTGAGQHAQRAGPHDNDYAAENIGRHILLERLSAARDALRALADVPDERLGTVPLTGSFRFCDGQRTLEQVVDRLLNHQSHQVDAITAVVGGGRSR